VVPLTRHYLQLVACVWNVQYFENYRSLSALIYYFRNIADNAMFWQNVLLHFENDPLSPSFQTFSIVVTWHTKYGRGSKHLKETQSRFQSFVPLDQRSENEGSGSIHFQITMEITEFCISGFTAQCAVCIYSIYGACLKWMLPELSFSDRWSRGTKLWERDWRKLESNKHGKLWCPLDFRSQKKGCFEISLETDLQLSLFPPPPIKTEPAA